MEGVVRERVFTPGKGPGVWGWHRARVPAPSYELRNSESVNGMRKRGEKIATP